MSIEPDIENSCVPTLLAIISGGVVANIKK
jgi:hypothetical protein